MKNYYLIGYITILILVSSSCNSKFQGEINMKDINKENSYYFEEPINYEEPIIWLKDSKFYQLTNTSTDKAFKYTIKLHYKEYQVIDGKFKLMKEYDEIIFRTLSPGEETIIFANKYYKNRKKYFEMDCEIKGNLEVKM